MREHVGKHIIRITLLALISMLAGACGTSDTDSSTDTVIVTTVAASVNGPVARFGLEVIGHNGKLYALGSGWPSSIIEKYNPSTGTWIRLTDLAESQEFGTGAVVNGKIYLFGSYGPKDITQVYDIASDTWSSSVPIPMPLYWATAEAIGTKIYLIGGYSPGNGGSLNTVYIFDTETEIWSQGADLPLALQIPSSASYGSDIYVFYNSLHAYKYDTLLGSWEQIAAPPSGHGYASEAVTVGDEIYLIGGNTGNIYEAYTYTDIFDITNQTWRAGPSLIEGRYQFGADEINGKIYAVCGRNIDANATASVEYLDTGIDGAVWSSL